MTFEEIITKNSKICSAVSWWPFYAYHFTDVQNAIGILSEGVIYSRIDAKRLNLMQNDNASRQVIDMTRSDITSDVRLYFRPKTPTQYYNEGYKHPSLRFNGDHNANIPVPVFFAFDLAKVLKMENTYFSEKSQAGVGSELYNSVEEFSQLNFFQIYKDGAMQNPDEEKKFRHAEIIVKGKFDIDASLAAVLCRNECEKVTLLNLLRKKSNKVYNKYKDRIKVCRKDMFMCNGLYVTDCRYYNGIASIGFSTTRFKQNYIDRNRKEKDRALELLNLTVDFEWSSAQKVLHRQSAKTQIDYEKVSYITCRGLKAPKEARSLYIIIKVEDELICYMGHDLAESALL